MTASSPEAGGPGAGGSGTVCASLATLISAAALGQANSDRIALDDGRRRIPLAAMAAQCWVAAPREALAGRNLLLLTERPLSAALALASLDGLAARIVIAPPDVGAAHYPLVIADAAVDAIVHDGPAPDASLGVPAYAIASGAQGAGPRLAAETTVTEWDLFTSGTSGAPKMVAHDLAGLTHAIPLGRADDDTEITWGTFYDIRRYGGLQMLLRALTGGCAMQLTSPGDAVAGFLDRLAAAKTTNISGTPSHWRRALMHPGVQRLTPRYVRLSGEIADQAVLDALAAAFPDARVGHAYASTEAGVGFEVTDGLEGFPADYLERTGPVVMRLRNGALHVRSPRTAGAYLGKAPPPLHDAEGFVDTGDLIERRGDRLYFMGRATGVINVGGLKVHPEEVEAVINRAPGVRMSRVRARRNAILGAVVAADVVLNDPNQGEGDTGQALRADIQDRCRAELASHKAPASIRFVKSLAMTAGGKLERQDA